MPSSPGHLFLTGYRGSGKSSVAHQLGLDLGLDAIDLDDQIEARAGCSIRDIFATAGEAGFRDREQAALEAVAAGPLAVIALGGGAVLRQANRQTIRRSGLCVWLDADAATLAARIRGDALSAMRRPALTELPPEEEVQRLLTERQPLYAEVAALRVETPGQSVVEIAETILAWLDEQLAG